MAKRKAYVWRIDYETMLRFKELIDLYAWEEVGSDRAMDIAEQVWALPGYPKEAAEDARRGIEPIVLLEPVKKGPDGFIDLKGGSK